MIFINMVFSVEGYQKLLSFVIPRKFKFVDKIEVLKKPYVKHGTLYVSFLITTKKGLFDKMKSECKTEKQPGDNLTFWGFVICLGKDYDLIGLEKETQELFNSLSNIKTVSRVIKTQFIIN